MTKDLQTASFTTDFVELRGLFGPPPVLSSEDLKAYDAMFARILKSLKPTDFIEQMLGKDLTDATWEMKRYSRHKALVIERQYREQQELEEAEEAEETAEQVEESAAVDGAQSEQVEDVKPAGEPTTQFDRMLELAAVVDSVIPDCDEIILGPVDELKYAAALENNVNYYERLDRLHSVAMARRDDVLRQLDFYRQGLGRHLRQVTNDIIEGEFLETKEDAPSIAGSSDGGQ
jgi:hypothetical protein